MALRVRQVKAQKSNASATSCGTKVRRGRFTVTRAAAADAKTEQATKTNNTFMLNDVQNESFAEQLREKTRYYREKGWPLDFFLVSEPKWLDEQHPQEAKKVQRPCIALVAAEESWARYMKLRLDRVLFVEVSGTQDEVTQCGAPVPDFDALDKQDKKWTAPYTPYAKGWWDVFMPGKVEQ